MFSIIGLFFSGIIGKAMAFLKALPWQVWAILGVVLALLFAWHVHTNAEKAAYNSAFNAGFAVERARAEKVFAIQRESIAEMRRNLDAKNAESDARAKALADSKATDAQNVATADARQKADRGRIQTLQALAKDLPVNPACRAPAAVVTNLEGL